MARATWRLAIYTGLGARRRGTKSTRLDFEACGAKTWNTFLGRIQTSRCMFWRSVSPDWGPTYCLARWAYEPRNQRFGGLRRQRHAQAQASPRSLRACVEQPGICYLLTCFENACTFGRSVRPLVCSPFPPRLIFAAEVARLAVMKQQRWEEHFRRFVCSLCSALGARFWRHGSLRAGAQ